MASDYILDLRKIIGNIPLILCTVGVMVIDVQIKILLRLLNSLREEGP